MKRPILLGMALASLTVFAFGDVARVAPNRAAPASSSKSSAIATKVASKAKAVPSAPSGVLIADGVIFKIQAPNAKKKLPELISVRVGKKLIEIAVDTSTIVKSAKGRVLALAKLKKGEKVRVDYRIVGAENTATLVTILF